MVAAATKRCSKCLITLTNAEFGSDRTRPDGFDPWCKPCKAQKDRRYRETHRAEERARARVWAAANPERVADTRRRWKTTNRAKVLAQGRAHNLRYMNANREAWNERSRQWRAAHPEEERERNRLRALAHPEAGRERTARRRARIRKARVERIDWRVLWARTDGNICRECGLEMSLDKAIPAHWRPSLDHMHPLVLGGAHSYDNVQLLHLRCNIAKGARPAQQSEVSA